MNGIRKRAWMGAATKALGKSTMKGMGAGALAGGGVGAATADEDESTLGSAAKGMLGGAAIGGVAGKGYSKLKGSDSFDFDGFGGMADDAAEETTKRYSPDLDATDAAGEALSSAAEGASDEAENIDGGLGDLSDSEKSWSDTGMGSYE